MLALNILSALLALSATTAFAPSPLAPAVRSFGASSAVRLHAGTTRTGTSYLPPDTVERAAAGNKFEKDKLAKDGTTAFTDVYEYAKAIREGQTEFDKIDSGDVNMRLKWVGMLSRFKRTPGRFMMRLRVPNGIITAEQMRLYADAVEPYGPEMGVIDITTRQNIQLRGLTLEDGADMTLKLHAVNQTSFQSALDNVRNLVGSPLAGIDDQELVDTRPITNAINDLISLNKETGERGNPVYGNLPRKFNVAVSGSRDDFAHTHINDIGLQPCANGETGEMGFNVVLGGYMSTKRVAESVDMDMWIPATVEASYALCEAILRIFRDEGGRKDRQKARLMWLVEEKGVEAFKAEVVKEIESYKRGIPTNFAAQKQSTEPFVRRELLGVHSQPQEGKMRVGVHIPTGRLSVAEARQIADLADSYSAGEIRLTVEQNVILPNVDEARVDALLAEPSLNGASRLSANPGHIVGNIVSCTGAQFCPLAIIDTKAPAERVAKLLDERVEMHKPLRIHWTGCPNSCGQAQAGDIGIMGGPAKKLDEETGKMVAVPGCQIFVGGTIGEEGHLSLEPYKKGIPLEDEILVEELIEIIVEQFGGKRKSLKRGKFRFIGRIIARFSRKREGGSKS